MEEENYIQWEYKRLAYFTESIFDEHLQEHGLEGWEAVSYIQHQGCNTALLKRRKRYIEKT
jgi:hypothetical protein